MRPHLTFTASLFALPLALSLVAGCATSTDVVDATDPSATPPDKTAEPSEPVTPPGPTTCVAPKAGAPTSYTAGGVQKITLPAKITGRTEEALEFFNFKFVLTDIAKVRVRASSPDFTDTQERAAIGVSLVTRDGSGFSAQLASYSTSFDKTSSRWLYPGEYELQVNRTNSATANTNVPILPHDFELIVEAERPPVETGNCTMPDGVLTKTEVRGSKVCNEWCKQLPTCGVACDDDCDVPVGQCAASVLKYLECETAANFECSTSPSGGKGYSIDEICKYDAKICDAADIRR